MKLTYPQDAPFAVDVPDLDAEEVAPGQSVQVPDGTPIDVVVSLVEQGWEPDSAAKKAVDTELKSRDDASEKVGAAVDESPVQQGPMLQSGETGVLVDDGDGDQEGDN